jgi:hypothetical protein
MRPSAASRLRQLKPDLRLRVTCGGHRRLVCRRGVGASIAAAYLFSILIFANVVVFESSQASERLASQSEAEVQTYDQAHLLSGVAALELLDRVQSFISLGQFQCSNMSEVIGSSIALLRSSATEGTLSVNETLSPGPTWRVDDNLTMLRPFNGSNPGDLSLSVLTVESGGSPSSGVVLHRVEAHVMNLPVHIPTLVSFCLSSVRYLEDYLSNSSVSSCAVGTLDPLLAVPTSTLMGEAGALGMAYSLTYSFSTSGVCGLEFISHVSQLGVAGPLGEFDASVEQEASASVRLSVS